MKYANTIANIAPIKQLEREVKEHQKYPCKHCNFQATQNRHLKTSHCDHHGDSETNILITNGQYMKEL